MNIKTYFYKKSSTYTYLVFDSVTNEACIIDPVVDLDLQSLNFDDAPLLPILEDISKHQLKLKYILETHPHADHITGAQKLKEHYPNSIYAIGKEVTTSQKAFKKILNLNPFSTDGSQFDLLLDENTKLNLGEKQIKVLPTPGHTPACISYYLDGCCFTGDSIFMPDFGSGRCDFPNGSAAILYDSIINNIFSLPNETTIYVGHDYGTDQRETQNTTTVQAQKETNIHFTKVRKEFINFRTTRDKSLDAPKLLIPSIQINLNAGNLIDNRIFTESV